MGSVTAHEEQSQQRASNHVPASQITTPSNAIIENNDSSNGGLVFYDNSETINQSRDEVNKVLNLPNADLMYSDIEVMKTKPRMPVQSRNRISRHLHPSGQAMKNPNSGPSPTSIAASDQKPLSPVIRRSAINNLVGSTASSSDKSSHNVDPRSLKQNQSNLRGAQI